MKTKVRILALALCLSMLAVLSGCDTSQYAASDEIIIEAAQLSQYVGKDGVVIVDMQAQEDYAEAHVPGAVNIPVSSVLVNLPVENMLASKGKITSVLGNAGIGNDTQVVIYDEGRSLNASRLWWSMLVYGKENVKVVSGGLPAIQRAGIALTDEAPEVTPAEFTATDRRDEFLTDMRAVRQQVDDPQKGVILLDTRSNQEYLDEGKIPGSLMYDYINNFYKDGTFINTQAARINYIEKGVRTGNEVILYCRTSMRAAVSFLRLYDAGYRNLKIYDGAWLEWTASGANPVDAPAGGAAQNSVRDGS